MNYFSTFICNKLLNKNSVSHFMLSFCLELNRTYPFVSLGKNCSKGFIAFIQIRMTGLISFLSNWKSVFDIQSLGTPNSNDILVFQLVNLRNTTTQQASSQLHNIRKAVTVFSTRETNSQTLIGRFCLFHLALTTRILLEFSANNNL